MLSSILFSFRILSSSFYFLIVKYLCSFFHFSYPCLLRVFFKFQILSFTYLFPLGALLPFFPPPLFLTLSSSICDTRYSIANSFRPRATLITINPIYLSLFDYQKFYTHYHITRRILLKTLGELIFAEIIRANILIWNF